MSLIDLEPAKARAGQLFCSCDAADSEAAERPALTPTALGFGLTILVQSLYIAVLPIAGSELTARPLLATLPYALTLVGALAASLPAAMLSDVFGRKSAFALGASLDLRARRSPPGALSIGNLPASRWAVSGSVSAQGFGFFYRHSAALAAKDKTKAIAIVLGAGAIAAIAAPTLLSLAQNLSGPLASAMALLFGGGVQIIVLALCLALPGKRIAAKPVVQTVSADATYVWASIAGALAWFGMALIMAGSPSLMAHCGIGMAGRAEVISWHSLAMYAPAAILGLILAKPKGEVLTAIGLALLAAAIFVLTKLTSFVDFGVVLIIAGCGWSLAMFGATLMVHAKGVLARPLLALHDAALFSGAILGAMAAAFLH